MNGIILWFLIDLTKQKLIKTKKKLFINYFIVLTSFYFILKIVKLFAHPFTQRVSVHQVMLSHTTLFYGFYS